MSDLRTQMRYLNPYDMHKLLINQYVLKRPGDTTQFKRDTSRDKRDIDVIRDNHKFLWDEGDQADTWELQFARKYYDKLFKEYCIGDLSLYKENKIALRWRTEQEVVIGKGQFSCGNKRCSEKEDLKTWEVNFGYIEKGEKKNALVKIRLCPDCSKKLNFHSKKREIKRLKKQRVKKRISTNKNDKEDKPEQEASTSNNIEELDFNSQENTQKDTSETPWENHKPEEVKSREEEMEDYLQDLLL